MVNTYYWSHFVFSDLQQKTVALKEKQHAISEMMSEIQEKDTEKEKIIQKIENLKEEQIKRKQSEILLEALLTVYHIIL